MLFVILVQGRVRTRNNAYVHPEDAPFFGKGAAPVAEEEPLVRRAQNVLRNDGENVPIFCFWPPPTSSSGAGSGVSWRNFPCSCSRASSTLWPTCAPNNSCATVPTRWAWRSCLRCAGTSCGGARQLARRWDSTARTKVAFLLNDPFI
jgi:hypothetical protein